MQRFSQIWADLLVFIYIVEFSLKFSYFDELLTAQQIFCNNLLIHLMTFELCIENRYLT